ncbi:MAG: chain-length determining protein [Bacteroidetes bacterium SW_9_63_38]|nr:MAG: chain-length determining protein [Bacteroidetes bacterium SW_9_63_38]
MSDAADSTDEPTGSPPGDGAPDFGEPSGPETPAREDEVSLLDILLVLARNKTLILRTVLVFTLLGVTYSVLAPLEYTSETKVAREAKSKGPDLPSGLGGIAGGLAGGAISGILGGASGGLGPQAFPEVLKGRAVRLAVVRDTFRFPDAERPMTYVDYVNRPPGILGTILNYTVKLPWTLKEKVTEASRAPAPAGTAEAGQPLIPSEEEDEALESIEERIAATVSQETGLMTIAVTAGGPQLASSLAESFLDHFTTRVRTIRTEKVREQLQFVEGRFEEAEQELEVAEDRLAQFLERNQNPTTATLQFRRDRLQRQVSFKEQLYSELQSQLTQTRLDLQQRQPVVTVVEEPVPPTNRSAPKRTLIVLLSVVFGAFSGLMGAFVKASVENADKNEEEQEKLTEIRERLIPARWRGEKPVG